MEREFLLKLLKTNEEKPVTKRGRPNTERGRPDIVGTFLALPEEQQRKIQKRGSRLYCLLLPGPRTRYPREEFPTLYRRRHPTIRHQGIKYLIFADPTVREYARLERNPEIIWIPSYSIGSGRNIEDILFEIMNSEIVVDGRRVKPFIALRT